MKKVLVLMVMVLVANTAFATNKVTNVTNVTKVTNVESRENNAWDYGVSGDVVLYETANSEWGVRSSYLIESGETRGYVTGKYYLNRATYQKK